MHEQKGDKGSIFKLGSAQRCHHLEYILSAGSDKNHAGDST